MPIGQWGAQKTTQRWRDVEPSADTLREITDQVMSTIREQVAVLRGEPTPTESFRRRPPS